jgi:hypothetical protein
MDASGTDTNLNYASHTGLTVGVTEAIGERSWGAEFHRVCMSHNF